MYFYLKISKYNFTREYEATVGKHANKDVIIHGVETIGSAERSTNKDEMREQFYKN